MLLWVGATTARVPVVALAWQAICLLGADGEERNMFGLFRSIFLAVAVSGYYGKSAKVDTGGDAVLILATGIGPERSDMLAALSELALAGALPSHLVHLPLFWLQCRSGERAIFISRSSSSGGRLVKTTQLPTKCFSLIDVSMFLPNGLHVAWRCRNGAWSFAVCCARRWPSPCVTNISFI